MTTLGGGFFGRSPSLPGSRTLACASARLAESTAIFLEVASVCFGKGMPSKALRFCCVDGGRPDSTEDVYSIGHWLQMAGSNAVSDSAQVIEHKSFRNHANQQPPGNVMRPLVLKLAVSIPRRSKPKPATIRIGSFRNLRPEADFDRLQSQADFYERVSVFPPSPIVHLAPAVGLVVDRLIASFNDTHWLYCMWSLTKKATV